MITLYLHCIIWFCYLFVAFQQKKESFIAGSTSPKILRIANRRTMCTSSTSARKKMNPFNPSGARKKMNPLNPRVHGRRWTHSPLDNFKSLTLHITD